MINQKELRYLQSVVKMKSITKMPFIFNPYFSFVIWMLVGILLAALKDYYESSDMSTYLFMSIIALVCFVGSMYIFTRSAYKSWYYVKPHINFESIENYINENKT